MRQIYRPAGNYVYSTEIEGLVHLPTLFISEPEQPWRETGLLDRDGNRLVATNERQPIGFIRYPVKCTRGAP